MKKLIFILISILLLASCSQLQDAFKNESASPDVTSTESVQALPSPSAALPSPSPSQGFTSCKAGESVSEYFYTGDLERFFTMSSDELCMTLGSGFEDSEQTIDYSNFGASFEYSPYIDDKNILFDFEPYEEEPAILLRHIILFDFDFLGLNKSSSFDDVINTLGESDLLAMHGEDHYYYALRYILGSLRFEFSSRDKKGTGGLTLIIEPFTDSQVFYKSCGKGDSVSPTLTTGDIKIFLNLAPEELDGKIGNGSAGADEDTGGYFIYFEYLGIHFAYGLEETEQGDDIIAYPGRPLECVWVDDFEFRGINKNSSFKDVMRVFGKTEVLEVPFLDFSYFALYYTIDGMQFEFSGSDKQASNGVSLSISPD